VSPTPTVPESPAGVRRAVSAVLGVVLMVVLVVVLASVVTGLVLTYDNRLEEPDLEAEQNPWTDDPLLGPEDPTAGAESVRYRVYFEIEDSDIVSNSLNDVRIFVNTTDDTFSGTAQSDLEEFEVRRVGVDETVGLVDDVDSWTTAEGGSELTIGLGGNYSETDVGDVVVVIVDNADNPQAPGEYDVEVALNGGDDLQTGTLEIVEA